MFLTARRRAILLLARFPARWLLFLLQLLRLLLMALFHLLPLRIIRLLLIQLHVLLVLLLLEFVPFLLLLRDLLFLLLLVLPVQLRVARIWSAPRQGRKVAGMDGRAGSSSVVLAATIGWSIRRSRLFGWHRAAVVKISGPRCGCGARLAHVRRRALLRVGSGRLRMLSLSRYRRDMSLTRRRLLFRPWTRVDSTVAAVVADVVLVVVDHGRVVNIVNVGDVHVVHRTVVEKVPAVPTPAFVTFTEIAEAVVDPAVEAYVRTPVAVIENKSVAAPAPIGWSPQETDFRRHHPGARHPVVIVDVVVVGPVAGGPDKTVARTKR